MTCIFSFKNIHDIEKGYDWLIWKCVNLKIFIFCVTISPFYSPNFVRTTK